MAKKKEQTEQERIAELRKNYIESLKRDIPKMPDKYDASKLPEVIKYVESVPDDNLDACLIMERPLSMLSVAYSWDDAELKKVTDVFDKLGYAISESKTLENENGEVMLVPSVTFIGQYSSNESDESIPMTFDIPTDASLVPVSKAIVSR